MGVRIGDFGVLFRVDPLIEKEIVSDKRLSLNQPFWAAEACFVSLAPNSVRLLRNVQVRKIEVPVRASSHLETLVSLRHVDLPNDREHGLL